MVDEDCPECGGMDPKNCPWCRDDSEIEEITCRECGMYLDDDGTCPDCDVKSRGRKIDRADKQQLRRRREPGLED
jgi:hypothetical protein